MPAGRASEAVLKEEWRSDPPKVWMGPERVLIVLKQRLKGGV